MTRHFERDMMRLERELLAIAGMVEEAVLLAVRALIEHKVELAQQVIAGDRAIDLKEVELEEDGLKILALHRPVAVDLRFIVAALKVNNDLERIGDMAVNIAERTTELGARPSTSDRIERIRAMSEQVLKMVRTSLNALVRHDAVLARTVRQQDDAVDDHHRKMYDEMEQAVRANPETASEALRHLSVSRNLERIADLATNIAEDVIFMVEGDVVRHRLGKRAMAPVGSPEANERR